VPGVTEPDVDAAEIVVDQDGSVATLWLNRPAKRNSVTYAMWRAIADHAVALADDPSVRVLVVRGVGDHFCAGADIAGLGAHAQADYSVVNQAAHDALVAFPKPTIAFIAGSCVGGGAQIAAACDLRIADTTARFGITPARLGVVYGGYGIERVVALIGPSAAKHLLYSAELIDADRALRIGLIDELHDPAAATARLVSFTTLLATQRSLLTQMAAKAMIDEASAGGVDSATEADWHRVAATAPDLTEGVAAFLERRDPDFRWSPPGRQ
jgi:enoyl-CoA hydratase/carnithine racemase